MKTDDDFIKEHVTDTSGTTAVSAVIDLANKKLYVCPVSFLRVLLLFVFRVPAHSPHSLFSLIRFSGVTCR
jgi:hypothetical protein